MNSNSDEAPNESNNVSCLLYNSPMFPGSIFHRSIYDSSLDLQRRTLLFYDSRKLTLTSHHLYNLNFPSFFLYLCPRSPPVEKFVQISQYPYGISQGKMMILIYFVSKHVLVLLSGYFQKKKMKHLIQFLFDINKTGRNRSVCQ